MTTLDDAVRAMLQDRAADIDALPRALAAETITAPEGVLIDLPPAQHPRSYRPFLLAAAGIVLLILGVVTAARSHNGDRRTPPAHPSTPPAPVVRTLTECATTVPTAWKPVLAGSTVTVPGMVDMRVAGMTTGGAAVVRYAGVSHATGTVQSIGYVPAGSATLHRLLQLPLGTVGHPSPPSAQVSVQGDQLLIVVGAGDAQAQEVDLIDVPSGHKQVVARTGRAGVGQILRAFLQGGHVYWQEISADATHALVRDYDIAAATSRVAAVDPVLAMSQSAVGVRWVGRDGRTVTHGDVLPPVIAAHVTTENFDSFITDGRAWAWMNGDTTEWWSPGPKVIARIAGARQLEAVAGPLIFAADPSGLTSDKVIDIRTGGVARIGTNRVVAHEGTVVSNDLLPSPAGRPTRLARVSTTDLPPMHC